MILLEFAVQPSHGQVVVLHMRNGTDYHPRVENNPQDHDNEGYPVVIILNVVGSNEQGILQHHHCHKGKATKDVSVQESIVVDLAMFGQQPAAIITLGIFWVTEYLKATTVSTKVMATFNLLPTSEVERAKQAPVMDTNKNKIKNTFQK